MQGTSFCLGRLVPDPVRSPFGIRLYRLLTSPCDRFFSTTYVAEIYETSHALDVGTSRPSTTLPHNADPATRAGSRAMFLHSCFSFFCSIVMPFLVTSLVSIAGHGSSPSLDRRSRFANAQGTYALSWSESTMERLSRRLPTIPFQWLDLNLLWAMAHVAFAVLMFSTFFVGSVWSATLVITLVGFSCRFPPALNHSL
jgi:solute carrier family 45 protein 1/2/4